MALVGLALVSGAMASGGCGSLPDLHFADADGSTNPFGEAGAEGGVVPGCKATGAERCGDGIDNDCNGLVDCQDSACRRQGFACQDVPSGWTVVSFSADARPGCPDGTDSVDLKVASGDGSATCMCSCNAVGGSCASGNFLVATANDGACASGAATKSVPVNSAGCTPLGSSLAVASRAMITEPAGPTSCAAATGMTATLTSGRLCQLRAPGGGCGPSQACAGGSSGDFASCVTTAGKLECPANFPKRSTAGTDATDTRSCTGCTCGAPAPCTGGSVSLFETSMCKANGGFQHSDGIGTSCDQLNPDSNFNATFFKSTPPTGGGCAPPSTPGTPTGTAAFTNERTVCCR